MMARHKKKPIAGALFLLFGGKAIFKYGASDRRFQEFRANNLVFRDAIRLLCRKGVRTLSFGRTDLAPRRAPAIQALLGNDRKEGSIRQIRREVEIIPRRNVHPSVDLLEDARCRSFPSLYSESSETSPTGTSGRFQDQEKQRNVSEDFLQYQATDPATAAARHAATSRPREVADTRRCVADRREGGDTSKGLDRLAGREKIRIHPDARRGHRQGAGAYAGTWPIWSGNWGSPPPTTSSLNDTRFSEELRNYLTENGFEVGVHGLNHDGKYYNSRAIFRERALKINRYIRDWGSVGFRSPSMLHNLALASRSRYPVRLFHVRHRSFRTATGRCRDDLPVLGPVREREGRICRDSIHVAAGFHAVHPHEA